MYADKNSAEVKFVYPARDACVFIAFPAAIAIRSAVQWHRARETDSESEVEAWRARETGKGMGRGASLERGRGRGRRMPPIRYIFLDFFPEASAPTFHETRAISSAISSKIRQEFPSRIGDVVASPLSTSRIIVSVYMCVCGVYTHHIHLFDVTSGRAREYRYRKRRIYVYTLAGARNEGLDENKGEREEGKKRSKIFVSGLINADHHPIVPSTGERESARSTRRVENCERREG